MDFFDCCKTVVFEVTGKNRFDISEKKNPHDSLIKKITKNELLEISRK